MKAHHGILSGRTHGKRGFTLIEMAIVLVIVGLLAGLTLPLISDLIKREKRSEAGDFLEKVKNEIIGFAIINKRLPTDLSEIGVGNDPYGQPLQYWVDSKLSSSNLCENSPADNLTLRYTDASGDNDYGDMGFIVLSTGRNVTQEYVDVGGAGTTIQVWEVRAYSGASEEFDDLYEYVSFNYLKNKICTNTANEQYNPSGSDVSFAQNVGSFNDSAVTNPPGQDFGGITINDDGTISLGSGVTDGTNGRGCIWYQGDNTTGNCSDGNCDFNYGFRAYFTFKFANTDSSADSRAQASGFTFAVIDGDTNTSEACGGTTAARYLGYADDTTTQINPYKFAGEIDIYPNPGTTNPTQLNDPPGNFNHVALVWWSDDPSDREYDNVHEDVQFGGVPSESIRQHEGERNAEPGDTDANDARAVAWDSGNVTWLEDTVEHTVRIEIYRNATANGDPDGSSASGDDMVNATMWIDCSADCSDLTIPYNGGADAVISQNATVASNATTPTGFQHFRFGWTEATAGSSWGGTPQDVTLSDFGIKFLADEPDHSF